MDDYPIIMILFIYFSDFNFLKAEDYVGRDKEKRERERGKGGWEKRKGEKEREKKKKKHLSAEWLTKWIQQPRLDQASWHRSENLWCLLSSQLYKPGVEPEWKSGTWTHGAKLCACN